MGCCRRIIHRTTSRSVLCLKWVNPIRIGALSSLAIHIGIILLTTKIEYNLISTVVVMIHLTVVYLLLRECRLSVKYHALLRSKD
jgi:riboflavin synthase